MLFRILIVFLISKQCSAILYNLNETEYAKLPALYEMDDYHRCMTTPEAVYCIVDADLRPKGPSELFDVIMEYSADTLKHYNHTQIHRGVCVNSTCSQFRRNTSGLEGILGECLNDTTWNQYKLEARLNTIRYCLTDDKSWHLDTSDIVMAVLYIVFILVNSIGSFYDILFCKDKGKGNPYLLAFSMRRNWEKLTASNERGEDPRLDRLKLFHGLRTMTMICVFFSHATLIMAYSYLGNPLFIEKSYEDPLKQLLFNGSLVTHTFFVMSSFLLAYNFRMMAEKRPMTWVQWPKGVLLRWLRLTPVYAFVLGTVCTWMRHMGSGPLWPLVVTSESDACRRHWWAHVLYVNNYVYDDVYCAPSTWYLAADTQLFCIGLLVCVLAQTPKAQKIVLSLLFVVSLVIPALHTYFEDLDAVVMQTPESYRNLYEDNNTFRLLYIRGHTNLSTYTLGLAGGFIAYNWQKTRVDFTVFKKHRWVIWTCFPLGVAVILSGVMFYGDGPRTALLYRVLYAMTYKPIFQMLIVSLIISCIFKFEDLYRPIMEWRGWCWSGRASYSAFLLHTLFQRAYFGTISTTLRITEYNIVIILSATVLLSFTFAAILWLSIEAPIAQLVKVILAPKRRHLENNMAAAAEAGDGQTKL